MTLHQFIALYDKEDSIILLEGKRHVADADRGKLNALGRLLAEKTRNMLFRSGNADGADLLFSRGVVAVDPARLQVITPYAGHRQKYNKAYDTIALDQMDIAAESDVVYQSRQSKQYNRLIDQYVAGSRDRYSIKAAYIIRDTLKAIGSENVKPATFGIFYDDLANPLSGGTGHTMKVCMQNQIPIIDQRVWMKWVEA